MKILQVEGAAFAYCGGQTLFSGLDVTLATGEVLCVLGPNGVGKSTLLRCLAGLEQLSAGTIQIANGTVSPGRATGFVPQSDAPVFAFDVRTVVEMGRAPHLSWTSMPGPRDATIVERAMTRLGIAHLAGRLYPELSGGERQLVMIARALAQQPALLILDEPTSHLDFANQADLLDLVRSLADEGLAVLMTTHDPDHAFLVADQVLVLAKSIGHWSGNVGLLTEARLSATYGRSISIATVAGRTLCFPNGRPDYPEAC